MTNEELLNVHVPGWRDMDEGDIILLLVAEIRYLSPAMEIPRAVVAT